MPKLKGKLTFRQHIEKTDYNTYRNFKDKILFSYRDILRMHDQWEEEKEKQNKKNKL